MISCQRGVRAALALAALLLALLPVPAHAHLRLRGASPAEGDTLAAVPDAIRLAFTTPVELAISRVALLGPRGEVAVGVLTDLPDSTHVVVAPVVGPLVAGSYTVRWQTAGADGHPVRGELTFSIRPGAAGLAPIPIAAPPAGPAAPGQAPLAEPAVKGESFDAGSPLYAAVRWLTFGGLLGAIGVATFRFAVLERVRRRGQAAEGFVAHASRRAAAFGLAALGVLSVALLLRLGAQSVALHGAERALDGERVAALLGRTVWGWGWLLQAVGTAAATAGLLLALRGTVGGWRLAGLGTVALAFSPALSGHAVGAEGSAALAILADGLHVLGAGGWLGSLLVVVFVGLPLALRGAPELRGRTVALLVNAFSPVALGLAGLVVVTGAVAAWLQLGSVPALWESGYGRILLLKLALLSVVFGTGAYNWRRVRPALGDEAATGRLRRSAAVELAAGALVLAVTAVLVATPPPREPAMTDTEAVVQRSAR